VSNVVCINANTGDCSRGVDVLAESAQEAARARAGNVERRDGANVVIVPSGARRKA
jgi:hypothetical protein